MQIKARIVNFLKFLFTIQNFTFQGPPWRVIPDQPSIRQSLFLSLSLFTSHSSNLIIPRVDFRRSREWRRYTRKHACFSASRACETANCSAWQYCPVSRTGREPLFLPSSLLPSVHISGALVSVVPSFNRQNAVRRARWASWMTCVVAVSASNYGAPPFQPPSE